MSTTELPGLDGHPLDPENDPEILEYVQTLGDIVNTKKPLLKNVGGNILICVQDWFVLTIITDGPRTGIYPYETDDEIQCGVMFTERLLLEILDPEIDDVDYEGELEEGWLRIEGDIEVYERLMELGEETGQSALALRAGAPSVRKNARSRHPRRSRPPLKKSG